MSGGRCWSDEPVPWAWSDDPVLWAWSDEPVAWSDEPVLWAWSAGAAVGVRAAESRELREPTEERESQGRCGTSALKRRLPCCARPSLRSSSQFDSHTPAGGIVVGGEGGRSTPE